MIKPSPFLEFKNEDVKNDLNRCLSYSKANTKAPSLTKKDRLIQSIPDRFNALGWTEASRVFQTWLYRRTLEKVPFPMSPKLGVKISQEFLQRFPRYTRLRNAVESILRTSMRTSTTPLISDFHDGQGLARKALDELVQYVRKNKEVYIGAAGGPQNPIPSLTPRYIGNLPNAYTPLDLLEDINELDATLGRFSLKVYFTGKALLRSNNQVEIQVDQWLYRVNDPFDFADAQFLGTWSDSQLVGWLTKLNFITYDVLPTILGVKSDDEDKRLIVNSDKYETLTNADFKSYQLRCGKRTDFYVFSDPSYIADSKMTFVL